VGVVVLVLALLMRAGMVLLRHVRCGEPVAVVQYQFYQVSLVLSHSPTVFLLVLVA